MGRKVILIGAGIGSQFNLPLRKNLLDVLSNSEDSRVGEVISLILSVFSMEPEIFENPAILFSMVGQYSSTDQNLQSCLQRRILWSLDQSIMDCISKNGLQNSALIDLLNTLNPGDVIIQMNWDTLIEECLTAYFSETMRWNIQKPFGPVEMEVNDNSLLYLLTAVRLKAE